MSFLTVQGMQAGLWSTSRDFGFTSFSSLRSHWYCWEVTARTQWISSVKPVKLRVIEIDKKQKNAHRMSQHRYVIYGAFLVSWQPSWKGFKAWRLEFWLFSVGPTLSIIIFSFCCDPDPVMVRAGPELPSACFYLLLMFQSDQTRPYLQLIFTTNTWYQPPEKPGRLRQPEHFNQAALLQRISY